MKIFKLSLCGIYLFLCNMSSLQAQQFFAKGYAYQTQPGSNTYVLTQAYNSQTGIITNYYPLKLTTDFEINFQLYFGYNRDGADGITFVMTNECSPALAAGQAIGVQGIRNSLISEFDTYYNSNSDDIPSDHTSFYKNGYLGSADNVSDLVTPLCMQSGCGNVKDGQWHNVKIKWQYISATSQEISVYFDNVFRNSSTRNHISDSFANSDVVFWSMTAATGGKNNLQMFNFIDTTNNNNFNSCYNTPITLTAPALGTNYSWTSNSSTTKTAIYTPTTNQTVSCYYTDKCGSARKVDFNLSVYESLDYTIGSNPTAICSGNTAIFTISGVAGNKVTYTINGVSYPIGTIQANGKLVISIPNAQTDQSLYFSQFENIHGCKVYPQITNTIKVDKIVTTSPIQYN